MNNSLTNRELLDELRLRLDEAHNPGWDDGELVVFVNNAIYEWVSETYTAAEANERNRSELSALLKEDKPLIVDRRFTLKGLYTLTVEADYNFECAGQITKRTVPVRPLKHDTDGLDPFSFGGTDYFPGYKIVESLADQGQQIKRAIIVSPGVPVEVRTVYIDEAQLLVCKDGDLDNEDDNIGLPRLSQLQILDRAVRTITGVAENAFRVQTQSQLEIPAKN